MGEHKHKCATREVNKAFTHGANIKKSGGISHIDSGGKWLSQKKGKSAKAQICAQGVAKIGEARVLELCEEEREKGWGRRG